MVFLDIENKIKKKGGKKKKVVWVKIVYYHENLGVEISLQCII